MSGKMIYMGLLIHGKRSNGRKFKTHINLDLPLETLVVEVFEKAKQEVESQLGEEIVITSVFIEMMAPPV